MLTRILLYLLLTCFSMSQMQAQVIASENFDSYPAGNTIGGGMGGTGWAAGWEIIVGDDKMIVADSIKNYRTGIATGTALDVDYLTAGDDVRMDRQLATPVTDDGNTYWLAFDAFYEGPGGGNASVVAFANTAATAPTGPGGQLIIFGKVAQGDGMSFGVGLNSGNNRSAGLKAEGTHWVVAKVEFSGDGSDDTVYLFINPDPASEPANTMADASFTTNALNSGFDGIFIKNEGSAGIRTVYDNLILGNNYADVVPTGTNTVPKYRPVAEKFDYAASTNLEGQGTATDGWGGAWEFVTSPGPLNVVNDSISSDAIVRSTSPNAFLMTLSGETRIKRDLAETYEDNGLTYWFSFFADISGASNGNVMNIGLVNNDTETMGAGGAAGQFVLFGKMFDNEDIGLGKPCCTFNTAPGLANQANWYVARIETNGTADKDTVRLFLNPDPNVEPQVGEEILKFDADKLNGGWKAIGMKASGSPTTLEALVDDIYLGLSYLEVVPDDLAVLPTAPTPAFDKFSYSPGTVLDPGNPLGAAENGWAGPWTSVAGTATIETDSIENFYNVRSTTGNAMELDHIVANTGNVRLSREFETPYLDNGRTYWMGFWYKAVLGTQGEVFQVMLGDVNQLAATGAGGQLVRAGINFDSRNLRLFTAAQTVDAGVPGDTTHWVVLKVETTGNADADTIRVFVDPVPGIEPADDQAATKMGTTALNDGFNGIIVKNEGPANTLRAVLDNLYVGNSFDEVTPDDLVFANLPPKPAFDRFDYTAGEVVNETTSLGGKQDGWNGPWKSTIGTASVVNDSIQNFYNIRSTGGNALELDHINTADDVRLVRGLETAYLDNGRTYWMGFWYKADLASTGEVFQVILGDSATFGASGPGGQPIRAGINFDSKNFKVFTGPQTIDAGVEGDTTRWAVMKIEMSGDDAADTVRIFMDPDPSTEPANEMALAKMGTTVLNDGWNSIIMKVSGPASTLRAVVDNLYIGNSYNDIVPDDLTDLVPLNLPEVAHEPFSYTIDSQLEGQGTSGEGWGGSWSRTSGDLALINEGSIETEFAVFEGNRASIAYTSEEVRYDRPFKARFEDQGQTLWMSWLMDFEQLEKISTEGQLVLMDGTEEVIGFGRTSGFNRIGFTWDPEVFEFISDTPSEGRHWIVVRLDMSGDDEAESIYMWVDPIPEFQPVLNQAAVFTTPDSEKRLTINDGFTGIRIKAVGSAPFAMSVDEFRIGFTYADISKIEEEVPENTIARDQFKYGVGDPLAGQGPEGSQWKGPWRTGFDGGGESLIQEGSLSNGSSLQTDGNYVLLNHNTATKVRPERDLATFVEDDGSDYWLSFLADFSSDGQSNVTFLFLTNYRDFSGNNAQRIGLGKNFGVDQIGIFNRSGDGANSTVPMSGGTKWLLSKLEFTGDEEPDTVYLWIDHNPEVEPDKGDADIVLLTTALNQGFQGFMIKNESANPVVETLFAIDEIRFGTTYESVAPTGDGGEVTGIEDLPGNTFKLHNYPNPFDHTTTISYTLDKPGATRLAILDMTGRVVLNLDHEYALPGSYTVTWDGEDGKGNRLKNGIYLYRLSQGGASVTKRLVLLK